MAIKQQPLEEHILNGQEHSYGSLCRDYDADDKEKMQIDRTLQKLRRAKKIGFRRVGRVILWNKVSPKPVV